MMAGCSRGVATCGGPAGLIMLLQAQDSCTREAWHGKLECGIGCEAVEMGWSTLSAQSHEQKQNTAESMTLRLHICCNRFQHSH